MTSAKPNAIGGTAEERKACRDVRPSLLPSAILAGLILLVLFCGSTATAAQKHSIDPHNVALATGGITDIGLKTGPCEGMCPVFSFRISQGDVAHYEGDLPGNRSGDFVSLIDFDRIAEWVATQNLPKSSTVYNPNWVDAPTEVFTVTRGAGHIEYRNSDAGLGPPVLFGLRSVLDDTIQSASWWPVGPESKYLGYYLAKGPSRFGIYVFPEEKHRVAIGTFGPVNIAAEGPLNVQSDVATFSSHSGVTRLSLINNDEMDVSTDGARFTVYRVGQRTYNRVSNGGSQ